SAEPRDGRPGGRGGLTPWTVAGPPSYRPSIAAPPVRRAPSQRGPGVIHRGYRATRARVLAAASASPMLDRRRSRDEPDPRRRTPPSKEHPVSDTTTTTLQRAVLEALADNPLVHADEIAVQVLDGAGDIVLRGTV